MKEPKLRVDWLCFLQSGVHVCCCYCCRCYCCCCFNQSLYREFDDNEFSSGLAKLDWFDSCCSADRWGLSSPITCSDVMSTALTFLSRPENRLNGPLNRQKWAFRLFGNVGSKVVPPANDWFLFPILFLLLHHITSVWAFLENKMSFSFALTHIHTQGRYNQEWADDLVKMSLLKTLSMPF